MDVMGVDYLRQFSNKDLENLLFDVDPRMTSFTVDDNNRETAIAMVMVYYHRLGKDRFS